MLKLQKMEGGTLLKEDSEQLDKLMKEREECLKPVRIRITAHDRLVSITQQSPSQPRHNKAENSEPKKEEEEEEEEPCERISNDDDELLLETLELLKSRPTKT
jgi:hypothetical protein